MFFFFFVFFFQAEDGIRDLYVTGVQTCALPICSRKWPLNHRQWRERIHPIPHYARSSTRATQQALRAGARRLRRGPVPARPRANGALSRSEERRVGKECRSRGARDDVRRNEEE